MAEFDKPGSFNITVYGGKKEMPGVVATYAGELEDWEVPSNSQGTSDTKTVDPPSTEPASSEVSAALKEGYSKEQVSQFLQETKGLKPEEADFKVISSLSDQIREAKSSGYSDDEVRDFLITNRYDGATIDQAMKVSNVDTKWTKLDYNPDEEIEKAENIIDLYNNLYSKYSTSAKSIAGIFDEQKGIEARRESNMLSDSIVGKLKENGIDAFIDSDGSIAMRDSAGNVQEVDSTFLGSLAAGRGEIGLGVAGGVAGGVVGGPLGAIAGSMVGASLGKGIDLVVNSMKLKEDIDNKLYKTQMIEAAIADPVMGAIGLGSFKVLGYGSKGVMKAFKSVLAGNVEGALKVLRDNLSLTKEQAEDITAQWMGMLEKAPTKNKGIFKSKETPLSPSEQQIVALTTTQRLAEGSIFEAAAENTKLANVVKTELSNRAKGLMKVVKDITDENIGSRVRADLNAYRNDVKSYYAQVKQMGADVVDGTDFRFKFGEIAVTPVLESIQKKIADPFKKEMFLSYAARIEEASQNRTFSGLIDFRQAVNDFKYSKSGLSNSDIDALNKVLNTIDTEIGSAVKKYMPNGAEWAENFKVAKSEYAKMKSLENNALYSSIVKEGKTDLDIRNALSKYANAKDVDMEVLNPVMDRLSPKTRARVEGAAIKNLTDKYTLGKATDIQAIHFPMLSEDLKMLNIKTPEAKRVADAVHNFAKVFKNDDNLYNIHSKSSFLKVESNLASSVMGKVKMSIIGKTYRAIVSNMPTRAARETALIRHVERLLENPMHFKTAEDFINQFPKGPAQDEMRSLVGELRAQMAKTGQTNNFTDAYKVTESKELATSIRGFGEQVYLSNLKPQAHHITHSVNLNRLATLEDVSSMVSPTANVTYEDFVKLPKSVKEGLIQNIKDRGFVGIRTDKETILFPETVIGVKPTRTKHVLNAEESAAIDYIGDKHFSSYEQATEAARKTYGEIFSSNSDIDKEKAIQTIQFKKWIDRYPGSDVNDMIDSIMQEYDKEAIEFLKDMGIKAYVTEDEEGYIVKELFNRTRKDK